MGKAIRYTLLISLFPICCAYAGNSRDSVSILKRSLYPQPVRHVIKTNPLPIFWGTIPYTAEYRYLQEVPVAQFQSSQIGFSYLGKSILLTMTENTFRQQNEPRIKVTGFRVQFSHRFYFRRTGYAPEGAYLGPHVSYSSARFSTRYLKQFDYYVQATHFNANLLVGYQTISSDWLVMDFYTGLGYKSNKWEQHYYNKSIPIDVSDIPLYGSHIKLTVGFNMGMAF